MREILIGVGTVILLVILGMTCNLWQQADLEADVELPAEEEADTDE